MRKFVAVILCLIFASALAAPPTDQECKMDPRKEGCQRK